MNLFRFGPLLVLVLNLVAASFAQQDCRFPLQSVPGPILFTPAQETLLGDILTRSTNSTNRVLEDDALRAPLLRIGNRLAANAPKTGITPQFTLVDLPDANAFTFPGGRIYVTKKLIAASHNEDELAGVLAHEMGHVYTRQIARDYSEIWRAVLNVTSLPDNTDIEEKFHRVMDTYAANSKALRKLDHREDREQVEADTFGINLVIRAGYDPKSYADFFDRVTETRGRKGNWLSDIFGMTKPDSKRLREMIRTTVAAPSGCVNTEGKMTPEEFSKWRQAVVAYSGFGKQESLPPNALKQVMKDPLRSEIRHLRFSADGKYVLAQDDASIYVMTREPFANLFRIDSEKAFNADFTPDSKSLAFHTDDMRVEVWDIAQQQLSDSYELHVPRACMQSVLSPTGDYLACLQLGEDNEFPAQVAILDVKTGDEVWVKKSVFDPTFGEALALMFGAHIGINLEFSPDGRFLAGSRGFLQFAFDLQQKQPVQLGKAKNYMQYEFVFLSNDTILGELGDHAEKSAVVKFPTGDVINQVPTGVVSLDRVAAGNYAILRPVVHAAAAILDLNTKKYLLTSQTRAIDMYNGIIVAELQNGGLGLFKSAAEPPIASAMLPKGPMTSFTAVSVSSDFGYVAYSGWMRGAIWDLKDGTRVSHVRGFRGAYFQPNHDLLALFPPQDSYTSKGYRTKEEWKQQHSKQWQKEDEQKVGAESVRWIAGTTQFVGLSSLAKRFDVWQHGPYLLVSERLTADGKEVKNRELEIRDVATGKTLWSRKFPGGLSQWFYNITGDSFVLVWRADDDTGKDLLKADSALRAKVNAFPKKKGAGLIEVLSHRTGERRFVIPFDTGEFSIDIRDVDVVGETVMVADTEDRLLILNSKGERLGRIFATRGILDPGGKLLAAQTEPGRITLLSTDSMQKKQVYTFGSRIAYMAFSADSKHLIVITADQTFYTFEVG